MDYSLDNGPVDYSYDNGPIDYSPDYTQAGLESTKRFFFFNNDRYKTSSWHIFVMNKKNGLGFLVMDWLFITLL